MTTLEQALATADRWLNPTGPDAPDSPGDTQAQPRREVKFQEFDLGWVVWAAPPPAERDRETGERRPPAEVGAACGVVDRNSGELTVWPSVPVDEVVRMYRQKHGSGSAASGTSGASGGPGASADRPATGPGNTAVFAYVDPRTGEESNLFRTSAPGLPPAEYQAWSELQRMDVPVDNIVAVHTDLRPSLLPGGYTAELVNLFPNAELSCAQVYGARAKDRSAGVEALVEQVEQTHRLAGRTPPPRPHRAPLPERVPAAAPVTDSALGEQLTAVFGQEGVRRYAAETVAATRLPEPARSTLTRAGLPVDLPLFFTADDPGAPPAGGLFTDVPTNLRERRSPAGEEKLATLGHLTRIGRDGVAVISVQCVPGSTQPDGLGAIWAIDPVTASARYVNISLAAYVGSLALLAETRQQMRGMDPYEAGAAVAVLQEQLAAADGSAQATPDTWWSLIIEQMWHGLF